MRFLFIIERREEARRQRSCYMARSEEVAFAGLAHLSGGFKHAAARSSSNKILVSYFHWVAHSCTIAPTMNLPFLLNLAFALSLLASPALSRTVYPWQQTMTGDRGCSSALVSTPLFSLQARAGLTPFATAPWSSAMAVTGTSTLLMTRFSPSNELLIGEKRILMLVVVFSMLLGGPIASRGTFALPKIMWVL